MSLLRRLGATAAVLLLVSCGSDDSSDDVSDAGGTTTTTDAAPEEALALELLPSVTPEYGSAATIGEPVDFGGVITTVTAIDAGPGDAELGPTIVVSMTFANTLEETAAAPAPRVQCAVGEVGDRSIPPDGSPFGEVVEDPSQDIPDALDAGESADGARTIGLPDCGENVPVVIADRFADGDHLVRAYWEVPAEAQG
jgi:hypothetical protein